MTIDFYPLCYLITSCLGFYHHFPGQSRPPPTPAHESFFFFLIPCHPEQSQLKNSFISPPSTLLITNNAESWITQNKRQIYWPQDINEIIRNKHLEALSSWENYNLLTPALQESQVLSHNYKTPRVLPAWIICWHTFITLAPCSHWPIISISTGAWNRHCWDNAGSLKEILFSCWNFPTTGLLEWPRYIDRRGRRQNYIGSHAFGYKSFNITEKWH